MNKEDICELLKAYSEKLKIINKNKWMKYARCIVFTEEYKWWPPPFFIPTVTIIQFCIYIYHLFYYHYLGHPITWEDPYPYASYLTYESHKRKEVWRFYTYSLVHAGIGHVLSNFSLQLLVGISLEVVYGWWRVSLVYILGVIIAGPLLVNKPFST